jgi:carboxylesterase type B
MEVLLSSSLLYSLLTLEGAFVLGKIDAQHDTAPIVQHSLTIKKPIITTSIQYRLGALGFIATPDGERNFGLKDQRNALIWVQKFIDGFGGDRSRVTLFGESAGGCSICCHMLSPQPSTGPLFNRVIIMSGVMGPMMTPVAEDKAANAFGKICESLSIKEQGEAALEKLRTVDIQELVSASDAWYGKGNSWSPVQDMSFFRSNITWDSVHELLGSCEWVDDMIVGNTGFEGQAYLGVANSLTPRTFYEHLKLALSDDAARKVMEAYKVTIDMDRNLFLTAVMRWFGDIVFDGTFNRDFHLPISALLTHTNSPHSRLHKAHHRKYQQEDLPLHLRHPQSLPQCTLLPTSPPLGRRLLHLPHHAIPIPLSEPQRYQR